MKTEATAAYPIPDLDGDAMIAAMTRGVAEALRDHRAKGVPIVTWDRATQQIVEIPADQIPGWIDEVGPAA